MEFHTEDEFTAEIHRHNEVCTGHLVSVNRTHGKNADLNLYKCADCDSAVSVMLMRGRRNKERDKFAIVYSDRFYEMAGHKKT
jgi:hypothetical protein